MALPKKKGIRKIKVKNHEYYWTVRTEYQNLRLYVRIGYVECPNKNFLIEIKFDDPWLSFPKKVNNEIGAVTPKIVKESIEFANLNLEWTEKPNSLIKLENGNFSIVN